MSKCLSRKHGPILLFGALLLVLAGTAVGDGAAFKLTSSSFKAGGTIGATFIYNTDGCTGGDVSPALAWSGAPAGTKSFVITLFDPDEKSSGSGWWHWVVYDIPASATQLAQGAGVANGAQLPPGTKQGRTDSANHSYEGPCPDVGDPAHHYRFTIYALSVDKLDVPADSSGALVTYTLHKLTLGKATLVGTVAR